MESTAEPVEQTDTQVEQVRMLALLFGTGAGLVAISQLLPYYPDANTTAIWIIVALAGVVTVALVAVVGRVTFPAWLPPIVVAFGSGLVAAGSYYSGTEGSALFAIFFIYASAYAFYYFSIPVAIAETVVIAVAYGVALALVDPETALAQWVIVVGASTIAGAAIGGAGARSQRLLRREHEVAVRLREVDEMKTALLRAVAHDLRTPLMSIGGFARLLRDDRKLDDDERELAIERIVANADDLAALVEDLLQLDRVASGAVSPDLAETDLVEVVRRAVASAAVDDRERVRLDLDGPVIVGVDPPRLERAVANLVSNALKYAPEGSTVDVQLEHTGDEARIAVVDRGSGVPDEQKESVFEPFVRGPEAARSTGTGLGLSLVRQFAQLHGGRAWVEDDPAGGARFVIAIPANGGRVTSTPGATRREGEPPGPRGER